MCDTVAQRRTFTIRLSEDELVRLAEEAEPLGWSVGQLIRQRLFPPVQAAAGAAVSRPAGRDGEEPMPRQVRPITRQESAR